MSLGSRPFMHLNVNQQSVTLLLAKIESLRCLQYNSDVAKAKSLSAEEQTQPELVAAPGTAAVLVQEFNAAMNVAVNKLFGGLEAAFGSVTAGVDIMEKENARRIGQTFVDLYGCGNGSDFRILKDDDTGEVVVAVRETQFVHWIHEFDGEVAFIWWFSQNFEFRFTISLFKQPRKTRKSTIRVGRNRD